MYRIIFFLCSLLILTPFSINAAEQKRVFIDQVAQHPAIDATVRGIKDGLAQMDFKAGVNLDLRVEVAQSNMALSAQIANKFVNQKPDIVVGVGTIPALSFIKYAHTQKLNVVFSSVTDPVNAGLIKDLRAPEATITGVSNFVALEPQLELIKSIQPTLTRLGFIYNAGESNSVVMLNKLKVLCKQANITLIAQTANKTSEMPQAAAKLAGQVEAIFISNDNTALSALQSIVQAANKAKVPVYVSDTDAVKQGALAALGPDQYQIGLQTGWMIAKLLNGSDIRTMPVEFPTKTDLFINLNAARQNGITIPETIKARATEVYGN